MLHKHGGDIYACRTERCPDTAGERETFEKCDEIADFSANINFRGMPPAVQLAARSAVADSIHYPDPECRALRLALAKRESVLQAVSGQILANQIICGNGAAELMFALAAAYRPRRTLLAVPSFFEYEQALAAFGCEIRHFELREEQDFRLDEGFVDAIDEETDCVVLGNPNNPTGRLIERTVLERIIKRCQERGILLVLDESFYDFLCDEDRVRTFSGICEILEAQKQSDGSDGAVGSRPSRIFVIRSFTKIYGMPGLRFGYGICADTDLLNRMRAVLQPWNVSLPAQAAAIQAASELAFAQDSARLNKENRAWLARQMQEAGYHAFPSEANFLLFCGPADLREYCLKLGFLIRDCSNFPGLDAGFFRICVRDQRENEALLRVLVEAKNR